MFFKGNTLSGTGAVMSGGGLLSRKATRDVYYQRKESASRERDRPSTQGRLIFGNAGSLLSQNSSGIRKSG